MKISLSAEVFCTDGEGGDSVGLVLNPLTNVATHLVVEVKGMGRHEVLLPLSLIVDSSSTKHIEVRCSREDLSRLQPLVKRVHVESQGLDTMDAQALAGAAQHSGIGFQDFSFAGADSPDTIKMQAIPRGELLVRRGIPVEATDHKVGHVEEFVVTPESGEITFLTLKEGHLFKHEISVPVDQIDRIGEAAVHLKLAKAAVEQLPRD